MYDLQLFATDDSDWSQAIELIDDTTNLPLADAATAQFDFQVTDHGRTVLSASTTDGSIYKPTSNIVAWVFPQAQMQALRPETTYRMGMRMTTDQGSLLLFTGTLAFINGGMSR